MAVAFLDALEAAESFKALFLPFGNEGGVTPFFSHAVVVKLARDLSLLVIKVVDVATHLMVHFEDRPKDFWLALSFIWFIFNIAHFLL